MIPVLDDPELDRDHEDFLDLALQLAGAEPAGALSALEALRRHAGAHFALEDRELRRLGGNNAACHIDEHAAVLQSFDEVLAVLRGSPAHEVARRLCESLSDELLRWLPHHVGDMDASLAAVRSKARLGGVPVRLVARASLLRM